MAASRKRVVPKVEVSIAFSRYCGLVKTQMRAKSRAERLRRLTD